MLQPWNPIPTSTATPTTASVQTTAFLVVHFARDLDLIRRPPPAASVPRPGTFCTRAGHMKTLSRVPQGGLQTVTPAGLLAHPFPIREHLVAPCLRQGESAMLWAPTGLGKTMLSLPIEPLIKICTHRPAVAIG